MRTEQRYTPLGGILFDCWIYMLWGSGGDNFSFIDFILEIPRYSFCKRLIALLFRVNSTACLLLVRNPTSAPYHSLRNPFWKEKEAKKMSNIEVKASEVLHWSRSSVGPSKPSRHIWQQLRMLLLFKKKVAGRERTLSSHKQWSSRPNGQK